ncbi:MAG: 3-5-bisphosphate nucleotidase, partial [Myxococcaceae bacterium]|nr:3-5-bisphosphate nucleotidase [Myxococcaceae bacterium]
SPSARMVGSRSHPHPRIAALARGLGVTDVLARGSVGLKVAAVATGEVDLYAHFGRGPKLWDGCAPEAIARGAGATVTDALGRTLAYDTAHLGLDDGLVVAAAPLHAAAVAELARLAAGA